MPPDGKQIALLLADGLSAQYAHNNADGAARVGRKKPKAVPFCIVTGSNVFTHFFQKKDNPHCRLLQLANKVTPAFMDAGMNTISDINVPCWAAALPSDQAARDLAVAEAVHAVCSSDVKVMRRAENTMANFEQDPLTLVSLARLMAADYSDNRVLTLDVTDSLSGCSDELSEASRNNQSAKDDVRWMSAHFILRIIRAQWRAGVPDVSKAALANAFLAAVFASQSARTLRQVGLVAGAVARYEFPGPYCVDPNVFFASTRLWAALLASPESALEFESNIDAQPSDDECASDHVASVFAIQARLREALGHLRRTYLLHVLIKGFVSQRVGSGRQRVESSVAGLLETISVSAACLLRAVAMLPHGIDCMKGMIPTSSVAQDSGPAQRQIVIATILKYHLKCFRNLAFIANAHHYSTSALELLNELPKYLSNFSECGRSLLHRELCKYYSQTLETIGSRWIVYPGSIEATRKLFGYVINPLAHTASRPVHILSLQFVQRLASVLAPFAGANDSNSVTEGVLRGDVAIDKQKVFDCVNALDFQTLLGQCVASIVRIWLVISDDMVNSFCELPPDDDNITIEVIPYSSGGKANDQKGISNSSACSLLAGEHSKKTVASDYSGAATRYQNTLDNFLTDDLIDDEDSPPICFWHHVLGVLEHILDSSASFVPNILTAVLERLCEARSPEFCVANGSSQNFLHSANVLLQKPETWPPCNLAPQTVVGASVIILTRSLRHIRACCVSGTGLSIGELVRSWLAPYWKSTKSFFLARCLFALIREAANCGAFENTTEQAAAFNALFESQVYFDRAPCVCATQLQAALACVSVAKKSENWPLLAQCLPAVFEIHTAALFASSDADPEWSNMIAGYFHRLLRLASTIEFADTLVQAKKVPNAIWLQWQMLLAKLSRLETEQAARTDPAAVIHDDQRPALVQSLATSLGLFTDLFVWQTAHTSKSSAQQNMQSRANENLAKKEKAENSQWLAQAYEFTKIICSKWLWRHEVLQTAGARLLCEVAKRTTAESAETLLPVVPVLASLTRHLDSTSLDAMCAIRSIILLGRGNNASSESLQHAIDLGLQSLPAIICDLIAPVSSGAERHPTATVAAAIQLAGTLAYIAPEKVAAVLTAHVGSPSFSVSDSNGRSVSTHISTTYALLSNYICSSPHTDPIALWFSLVLARLVVSLWQHYTCSGRNPVVGIDGRMSVIGVHSIWLTEEQSNLLCVSPLAETWLRFCARCTKPAHSKLWLCAIAAILPHFPQLAPNFFSYCDEFADSVVESKSGDSKLYYCPLIDGSNVADLAEQFVEGEQRGGDNPMFCAHTDTSCYLQLAKNDAAHAVAIRETAAASLLAAATAVAHCPVAIEVPISNSGRQVFHSHTHSIAALIGPDAAEVVLEELSLLGIDNDNDNDNDNE